MGAVGKSYTLGRQPGNNEYGSAGIDPQELLNLKFKCRQVECDISDNQSKIKLDEALNGEEAFEMFRKCHENSDCQNPECENRGYRVIIMDLQMPIMDGFEATEKIL